VLFNRGRVIAPADGGGFALVGVDDVLAPELVGGPGPRPAEALAALPPDLARVLLCHQPVFLNRAAAFGFDLMLSGHTHGGQIAPPGPIVLSRIFPTVAGLGGLYGTQLYVNRGLGTSGPPTRVLVRPEITKIVLVAG
jgi:predicted MPP superfamily phosphohydrolase